MEKPSFADLVIAGRFEDAIDLTAELPLDDLRDALLKLAFDSESIACYGFAVALVVNEQNAEHHALACEVLASTALCRLPGAYQTAYFHARQAEALAPTDPGFKELLLFFWGNPERVLTRDEARQIARELLELDPENAIARRVLDEDE